ncbi:hypothetical protein [Mesorhizobium caraganae]|uniref:hypothetical protein n=1 Tax=Mesorhizobium caraganae TaxID=483206 RepID=UPI00177F23D4|nr:hypothetical protein [Mesorhizobium caraganae]
MRLRTFPVGGAGRGVRQAQGKIGRKLTELVAKTPLAIRATKLDPGTAAGAFVRNLTAKSNVAQLDILASLTEADIHRLATLEADL